jgi:hypothetical protein
MCLTEKNFFKSYSRFRYSDYCDNFHQHPRCRLLRYIRYILSSEGTIIPYTIKTSTILHSFFVPLPISPRHDVRHDDISIPIILHSAISY